METPEPQWIGLVEASALYDTGTHTVSVDTSEYLAALVNAGMLAGRRVDGPAVVEISSDALAQLVERDLESFIRQGDDEAVLGA
jgi:hypothetical protein